MLNWIIRNGTVFIGKTVSDIATVLTVDWIV